MSKYDLANVRQFCECDSLRCSLSIMIPAMKAEEIKRAGQIIVVDGCEYGAGYYFNFTKQEQGYKVFEES